MGAIGGHGGWPAVLALAAALAAGGASAQESGEAPASDDSEIVLNEDGGWEVAEGGSFDDGAGFGGGEPVMEDGGAAGDLAGGEVVWAGGDDPDSVDGWELDPVGEAVADGGGSPVEEGSGEVTWVGEDLAEGGAMAEPGTSERQALARGARTGSAGAGDDGCSADAIAAWLCYWHSSY